MPEWRFNLPVEGMYWRTAGSCWREGPKTFSSTPRSRRPIWGADLGGGCMPRRDDIRKILIIGSGPTIIGQAGGFDYSGTQACKALKKLGYEIALANSNPAPIMPHP